MIDILVIVIVGSFLAVVLGGWIYGVSGGLQDTDSEDKDYDNSYNDPSW